MVTSIDPWRIYIYNEGLARFAVEIYDPVINKEKLCAHLTNFSLNKKNEHIRFLTEPPVFVCLGYLLPFESQIQPYLSRLQARRRTNTSQLY